MCGILGTVPSLDRQKFENVLGALNHRGPDGYGIWQDGANVMFGHRRLAILDTSDHGFQPMHFADRYSMVFNGEIYNFLEIKQELRDLGYKFVGGSDSEVLLAAFAHWREKCVSRFNGMWAIAIWDAKEKCLFLSRDRMGEKPLYFAHNNNCFVFASEQKALLPYLGQVQPSEHFHKMASNSYGYEATADCVFDGINRFPAAHYAWFDGKTLSKHKYWSVLDSQVDVATNYDDQVQQLRDLLLDSTKIRMRSDVAIGTGLSGGVDSSAIAACIAQVGKQNSSERVANNWQNSFVAAFPQTVMDESSHAKAVANHLGIKHNMIPIDVTSTVSNIEQHIYLLEDISEVNPVPHIQLYGAMRSKGIVVTLDGHGGDELFCGYESSPLHALADTLWQSKGRKDILDTYHDMHPKNKYFKGLSGKQIIAYLLKSKVRMIMQQGLQNNFRYSREIGSLGAHLYELSFESVLPTLLRNYDRYSMGNGVEIRMPLIDHRIVEFAFALPWSSKVRNGYTKSILRDAVAPWLPASIVRRKEKIGFAPPIHDWIRGPMREYMQDEINSSGFANASLIDSQKVKNDIQAVIGQTSTLTLYQIEQVWKQFGIYLWEKAFLQKRLWQV